MPVSPTRIPAMLPGCLPSRLPGRLAPAATSCPSAPLAEGSPPSSPRPVAAAVARAGGNRCGHIPSAPRFDLLNLPEGANPVRPVLIANASGQIRRYYLDPRDPRWDPLSQGERHHRLERALAAAGGPDTPEGKKLAARLARWRQQRSERREALVSVLTVLLAYTDIATLTIGIPSDGGWLGLSIGWIAERTGLSASRVKRALISLTRSGLLISTGSGRRFDRRRRCWVGAGWGPVRRLSFRVVRMLGLEVRWDRERRRQRKAQARHDRPAPPPLPRPIPLSPAENRQRLQALRRTLSPAAAPALTQAERHAAQDRNRQAAELAAQGLSPREIRQRLAAAAQPP